jgi:oligopeptide transport system substrate-binding protein
MAIRAYKTKTIGLVILATPALLLTGCGASQEGAQLIVTVVGEPGRGLAGRLEAEATQPGLVARDGAGQVVAGLASSWRLLDDGSSLILRLRPVKWSDGRALTASDVVFALRRASARQEPALAFAGIAGALPPGRAGSGKLGVAAPISRVVELRLAGASPHMLGWLADPGIGITRPGRNAPTLAAYVASGPANARLLTRRSSIANPEARPAAIRITTADSRSAIVGFARGDSDIVFGEGLAGLGEARTVARADALRLDPAWGHYGYIANSRKGALANPDVRRALAMAIDRPGLTARFGIAAIVPANGLLPRAAPVATASGDEPPSASMTDWLSAAPETRRDEARRILTAAGYSGERPLRLVLLMPPGRDHRSVAAMVDNDWRAVGVVLAVSELPASIIESRIARGDFDLAVTETALSQPDPAAALARWHCGLGPHCNPAADALLDAARTAPLPVRETLLAEAESELLRGPPFIPLFSAIRWALVARDVDGWVPNRAASHPLARLAVTRR